MIAVARAHDDGSGTLTLAGATQTVSTDSLEEAMAELIALVVDHARVTGRDVELVAHADGTRTGLRVDPDGGIVEDDRILAASLSRTRQLEEQSPAGKSRRRRGRTSAAGTAAAPVPAPVGIDDLLTASTSNTQDLDQVDEPVVDEPVVDQPVVDQPVVDQPDPEVRPRRTRRAAATAAAGTASAPSGTSQALQAARTRVLAALPPRSSATKTARVLLGSAAVAALLGGVGYVGVSNGSSDEPGAAPTTTAPVGSASSSSTPSPTAPTTTATPLSPARVVAVSRAPGRLIVAVAGIARGERVTITIRATGGKVRTLTRVITTSPLRWTLNDLASGPARWRVEVEGRRDATGTVRVKAVPPAPPPLAPPANSDPAPQPDPDPAPAPDPSKGGGGGGEGGGGGGGGGPVDPATQLPGPVG